MFMDWFPSLNENLHAKPVQPSSSLIIRLYFIKFHLLCYKTWQHSGFHIGHLGLTLKPHWLNLKSLTHWFKLGWMDGISETESSGVDLLLDLRSLLLMQNVQLINSYKHLLSRPWFSLTSSSQSALLQLKSSSFLASFTSSSHLIVSPTSDLSPLALFTFSFFFIYPQVSDAVLLTPTHTLSSTVNVSCCGSPVPLSSFDMSQTVS